MSTGYMPPAESVEWLTPPELYSWLDRQWHFTMDPSSYPRPAGYDGLKVPWGGSVYVNPPYGLEIRDWCRKAIREVADGHAEVVVMLLPARTDTGWFHECAQTGLVEFIRGRVKYLRPDGSRAPAPFPSILVTFSRRVDQGMRTIRVPGAGPAFR